MRYDLERRAYNFLRLVFVRERNDLFRWVMDGFMTRSHGSRSVLKEQWDKAADNVVMEACFACVHWKQLPERAESLHN